MPASSHATDHLVVAGFPLPKDPPVWPLHAMISVLKLVLNKEDTRQDLQSCQEWPKKKAGIAFPTPQTALPVDSKQPYLRQRRRCCNAATNLACHVQ